jgi:hypothetical protein
METEGRFSLAILPLFPAKAGAQAFSETLGALG